MKKKHQAKTNLNTPSSFIKKLFKLVFTITIGIFTLIAGLLLLFHVPSIQNYLGKKALEYASQTMQRDISCKSLRVSLLGTVTIDNLVIHHDELFGIEPMISVDQISISFDPLTIMSDQFLVRQISLVQPEFRILFDEHGNHNLRNYRAQFDTQDAEHSSPDTSDDSAFQELLNSFIIQNIAIQNGHFTLNHKPSGYFLDAPLINLNGSFCDIDQIMMVTLNGHHVYNAIPDQLEAHADIRIKADVWEGGVKNGLITLYSTNGETWLHSHCTLHNFFNPYLEFKGSLRTNLSELQTTVFLDQDLSGTSNLFVSGQGPASSLDIHAFFVGSDVEFSQFNIASFRAPIRYHDGHLTVTDGQGHAYHGEISSAANFVFPQEDRHMEITVNGKNVNLLPLMKDLDIPLYLSTEADVSIEIISNEFDADSLVMSGHLTGTELVPATMYHDSKQEWTPKVLAGRYFYRKGQFGISEASITHSDHQITINECIFASDKLAGNIMGSTINLPDLLKRINYMTDLNPDIPDLDGGADFSIVLGGTTTNYNVYAKLHSQSLFFRNKLIDHFDATAFINPSSVKITESTISGDSIQASGHIAIGLNAPETGENVTLDDACFTIEHLDLAVLNSLFELDHPVSGIAKGTVNMCSLQHSSCISHLQVFDFLYSDFPPLSLDIQGFLTLNGLYNCTLSAESGTSRLNAAINFPFRDIPEFQLEAFNIPLSFIPGFNEIETKGTLSFTANSEPSESNLVASYQGSGSNLHLEHFPIDLFEIHGKYYGSDNPRITWNAIIDRDTIVSSGHCYLTQPFRYETETRLELFQLSILSDFVTANHESDNLFSGFITMDASIAGDITDFNSWKGQILLEDMSFKTQDMTFLLEDPGVLQLDNSVVTLPALPFSHDKLNLVVSGNVNTQGTLALSTNGRIDLDLLDDVTDFFSESHGICRFDLSLRGPWEDPDFFGNLYIQEFFTYLPLFNVNLEDYHANIRFNQKIARLMYMEGLAGGSYLGGRGEFGIDSYLPELFDISFSGNDIELEYPAGFNSSANIDLGITGNLPQINISGLVDIRQSMYTTRINYKTMIVNESRAKLSFMERRPMAQMAEDSVAGTFNPNFNLSIRARDGILIDNNLARVEMSLRLDVLGTLVRPRVLGHIDILRGEVSFLQRSFELSSASIDFVDPSRIDPLITLQAGTTIDDYRVNLDISGNLYSDLNIRPSSTPPLNEIDLWNLLVIGKTRDQMASSDDYLAGGVAYITGSLQEQIERRFEYWIGFDEFTIDAVMSTYDESPSARFTAKKRFGPDVSVLYSRSATSTDDLLLIEYKISDNLFVIGHKNEDSSIGADIRYRWEFD